MWDAPVMPIPVASPSIWPAERAKLRIVRAGRIGGFVDDEELPEEPVPLEPAARILGPNVEVLETEEEIQGAWSYFNEAWTLCEVTVTEM